MHSIRSGALRRLAGDLVLAALGKSAHTAASGLPGRSGGVAGGLDNQAGAQPTVVDGVPSPQSTRTSTQGASMRIDLQSTRRWLAALAASAALFSGAAGAAVLGAPYALQGFEWGYGSPQFAAGADGGLIAVTDRYDLATATVRRYSRSGQLLGSQPVTADMSSVASDRYGNHVVANATGQGTYAAVFDRNGGVVVPRFQVSTLGQTVRTAMNETGMFVVVYNYYVAQPGTNPAVNYSYARVYNRDGSARGGALLLGSGTDPYHVNAPAVAMDGSGNFIVTLMRFVNKSFEQRLRRYSRDGALLSSIDDPTGRAANGESVSELQVSLAANSAGRHAFGWGGFIMASRTTAARVQHFDGTGGWVGSGTLLGRDPDGSAALAYTDAKVAIAGDGRVVAVWSRRSSNTDQSAQWNVYAREFAADGTPLTAEFRVDAAPATAVVYTGTVGVLAAPDGQYTVTWAEGDGGATRQWARRFRMEGGPAVVELSRGVPVSGLSGPVNSLRYFRFTVPPNTPNFMLTLAGAGDADMLVKYGEPPTLASYDIATGIAGSNEGASVNNPPAGDFYVGVFGYSAYSNVSLQADW